MSIKNILKRLLDRRPIINKTVNVIIEDNKEVLKGRTALVTGGTSGIGFSIAEAFIAAGATVIITGRDQGRLERALSLLGESHALGIVMDNCDVGSYTTKLSEMHDLLSKFNSEKIDILVNNAGVNSKRMPNALEEEYDKVLDTNLKGSFFLSQLFGKYFVKNNIQGNILNIASASSLRPADSAYTVAKWGIRGLTLGLAKSLGQYGITVNGIAPGPTATPMMISSDNENMNLDRIPLGRYIMPQEIANMAVILVSDLGRSIMGDIIYMTGGAGVLTYDDVNYSF